MKTSKDHLGLICKQPPVFFFYLFSFFYFTIFITLNDVPVFGGYYNSPFIFRFFKFN